MKWEDYIEWAASSLDEYRVVADHRNTLRLRRQLDGDVYTLVLTPRPEAGSLTVQVSFEARPF
jgi:hypothetical protein